MPSKAWSPGNSTTQQHAHIACRAHHGQATEEKVSPCRTTLPCRYSSTRYPDSPEEPESRDCDCGSRGNPVDLPDFAISMPGCRPCCGDQIKRENAPQNIVGFRFPGREPGSSDGHEEHTDNEQSSCCAVTLRALAERYCETTSEHS